MNNLRVSEVLLIFLIVFLTTRALQKKATLGDIGSHWLGYLTCAVTTLGTLKLVQWSQKYQ